ncbi:MAG: amidohydrolase family protein [Deltaproteobacteria bacterium]|nr:amidohydrolase family protein [Deltaproteobacteria bacterium]
MRTPSVPPCSAVRARTVIPLAGELPARGMEALTRPLARIDDGIVLFRDGAILAVEPYTTYTRRPDALPRAGIRDLGDVILVPGLVNCHTHLEISHMAGRTVRGKGFADWVASLVALDAKAPDTAESDLRRAVESLAQSGTAAAGDISSRMPRSVLTAARDHAVDARIFCEIIGHAATAFDDAATVAGTDPAFTLAGHAFYTTPGETVAKARKWCAERGRPFSLHLAEHEDEVQCLRDGSGKLFDLLRERVVPASWRPPGMSPVQYAASLGVLAAGTLAVHCVRCDAHDIATLASGDAAVCLCPRSNLYINVGAAPAKTFAEKGILLCLGTDSLASNTDLDVWNEAEFFLEKNILPAKALLRMATVNGAAVLGLGGRLGRLEKGMRFCYKTFPDAMNALFR